ncbi:MAG: transcription termination factor NusA [Candidatus Nomurabacteria bacterium]|jgi:N utilization substance protein A|nr:transcription termination factor NusA [Candidatus Nomurabacteria bacterium]
MDDLNIKQLGLAVHAIAEEKNLPEDVVMDVVQQAIAAAWRRDNGEAGNVVRAVLNTQTGAAKVFVRYEVVETPENPAAQLTLDDAKKIDKNAKLGGIVEQVFEVKTLGRVAAQTAKQVILQKLREAERDIVAAKFDDRVGEVITGTVQRVEPRLIRLEVGQNATGIMPASEQIPGERLLPGARVKVLLKKIDRDGYNGPELILSRGAAEFVRWLFAQEVPEMDSGAVQIKAIAREAGRRTKLAVASTVPGVDPVGTFVGSHGVRVQAVMNEIGEAEKIDIISYDDDIKNFIANALSPAEISSIELDEKKKTAKVIVNPDQQSVAIGRQGQNVRLASQLTGYELNIETVEK